MVNAKTKIPTIYSENKLLLVRGWSLRSYVAYSELSFLNVSYAITDSIKRKEITALELVILSAIQLFII